MLFRLKISFTISGFKHASQRIVESNLTYTTRHKQQQQKLLIIKFELVILCIKIVFNFFLKMSYENFVFVFLYWYN